MSTPDRCSTCGHPKSWTGASHYPDCARARALRMQPAGKLDECPAHAGEDRLDCRPCEALADERRERLREGESV